MQYQNTFDEICKSSILNATKALSKMIRAPVGLNIDSIEFNQIDHLHQLIKPDEITVTLGSPIKGKIPGLTFLLYSQKTAFAMCDVLLNRPVGSTKVLSDLEISALTELANIVIGNFLTSFANSLQIDVLLHHAVSFDCAPFNVIYEQMAQNLAEQMKNSFIKISFGFQHLAIKGRIIIIFDKNIIDSVIKNMGILQV